MPRIFIAVPVAGNVRSALAKLAAEPDQDRGSLRWVADHQYHITLKFLGDIAEDQVERVRDAVVGAVAATVAGRDSPRRFRLQARGLGAFPHLDRVRILWVGVGEDTGDLRSFHTNIEERLAAHGFARDDRPFTPHMTIARARKTAPLPPALQRFSEHDFGSWDVDRLQVIESRLSAAGSRYIVRHEIAIPQHFPV